MKKLRERIVNYSSALVLADMPMKDFRQKVVNYTLALVYPLWPPRLPELPGLLWMVLKHWLSPGDPHVPFPSVETALKKPDGLLDVGGPLTPERLLLAYREGIYPHCHIGPIKWWAPKYRMVLFLNEIHLSKNLRYLLRHQKYRVTFDKSFREVMIACSEPRRGKTPLTWITNDIIKTYCRLFEDGYAHSVEVWDDQGQLVAGSYGLAIGRIFFGESSFTRRSNVSKIGLAYLHCHLQSWGYVIRDSKKYSRLFKEQGARMIPRDEFTELIHKWRDVPGQPSPWKVDETLDVSLWKPKEGILSARRPIDELS